MCDRKEAFITRASQGRFLKNFTFGLRERDESLLLLQEAFFLSATTIVSVDAPLMTGPCIPQGFLLRVHNEFLALAFIASAWLGSLASLNSWG